MLGTMSAPTEKRPVRSVFTSRAGGHSAGAYDSFNLAAHVGDDPDAVERNRARLAEVIGLEEGRLVWMEQIHSPTVSVVDGPHDGPVPATDALVTTTPRLALAVLVADCVPVLLADAAAGVVAAAHAGRLGARNGIVARTVEQMVELGAKPENILAQLGPAAGGESYEVPADMAADVEARLPGSRCETCKGTPGLDLRAGLERQLRGLGVEAIQRSRVDTIATESLFSHRREGETGRQAGVVWLTGA